MIRKIVKEEIENREEKIDEIIKAQLENKYNRLDRISQKVVEISKSLEFTQEQLDEELAKLKNDVGKIQTNIKDIENNLLDICEKKLQDNIRNKLGITAEIEFDRCHGTGTFKRNQSKPRTIAYRLLRFKDKEQILQSSKKL